MFDREDRRMNWAMKSSAAALTLVLASSIGLAESTHAAPAGAAARFMIAQAMIPPTGMEDAEHPMPMNERYLKRFPQPVRVGTLIGLPVLDEDASTLGYVRQIVRTPKGQIKLIVSYSRWWGWFGRPVAVPLEVVGIEGRQLVSLDMDPDEYADAPTWQGKDATALPNDATVRVALGRN
jgi:hypothetical protein